MADDAKVRNLLSSTLDTQSARAQANHDAILALMATIRAEEDSIRLGGGDKAAEAQRAKGRLTARERLKLLLDDETEFLELGLWAAHGMYREFGGAPGAGVVTGLGRIAGRLFVINAKYATV